MIDCFVSCFRIKPHNNEALKVCLNPTSSFLYHYVLISSLYRYGLLTVCLYTYFSDLTLFLSGQHYCVQFYCVVFIVMTYRHFPTYAIGASGKIWRKLNFVQVIIEYMYGQMFMFVYNEDQLKSTVQHTRTPSAVVWQPCHLCYHPAAFLCHLHLILRLFLQEKIQHAYHKEYLISATLCVAMLTCAFKLQGGNYNKSVICFIIK